MTTTVGVMTPEQIDALPTGRELDALVAEKIMGWHLVKSPGFGESSWWWDDKKPQRGNHGDVWDGGWQPSTDIAAAWEAVMKLGNFMLTFAGATGWHAYFGMGAIVGVGETASLAICRAALKTVALTTDGE